MDKLLLDIKDVCLSYGERHVLCHIFNQVKNHDFIVLTGPNGGGKTTLLRLLAGLLPPTCGSIVRESGVKIGYLPQYRHIDRSFPTTVREIVRSGLSNRTSWHPFSRLGQWETRLEEMMRLFRIEDLATRPISSLSGGQWQRTLLARALVSAPDLLLLDEPETHLDEKTRNEFYDILVQQTQHSAVVTVSHDEKSFPHPVGRRIWHVEDGAVKEREDW
ncbi:MAG: ATP-binding cassette domain-containing protein [Alloprevotella sp.]|nr:ATP-binding cassette domain-containing protein [Bacteroidales bacterium]MDY2975860.1 ATP-binding cassette domain-containing protein [Alloprevotella sp.]MCI6070077.1 ATP-binding cassette domain-containing protein [Bacteroidales bacterium]MDD6555618.1 ATP-binding cassette domain-containing protein [Bacteroidales bacterium]MDD7726672.1 ATP-binding cassette domain-containing protein [Bacteroidales bacterium]